jgi:hypothetical protein
MAAQLKKIFDDFSASLESYIAERVKEEVAKQLKQGSHTERPAAHSQAPSHHSSHSAHQDHQVKAKAPWDNKPQQHAQPRPNNQTSQVPRPPQPKENAALSRLDIANQILDKVRARKK